VAGSGGVLVSTPKPTVEYDGQTYKVRSHATEIPDLEAMNRLGALIWLNRNTHAKGRSNVKPNPLAGLGDAISLSVR
jgi:hypothetical protein